MSVNLEGMDHTGNNIDQSVFEIGWTPKLNDSIMLVKTRIKAERPNGNFYCKVGMVWAFHNHSSSYVFIFMWNCLWTYCRSCWTRQSMLPWPGTHWKFLSVVIADAFHIKTCGQCCLISRQNFFKYADLKQLLILFSFFESPLYHLKMVYLVTN